MNSEDAKKHVITESEETMKRIQESLTQPLTINSPATEEIPES